MERARAIEEIKRAKSCTEYLTKSKGKYFICPFCGSGTGIHKTGAIKVFSDTNKFKCNACGKAGDVIDLIMECNNIDFNEAVKQAAADLNIIIDPYTGTDGNKPDPQRAAEPKPAQAADPAAEQDAAPKVDFMAYYMECKERLKDTRAISYLSARGISEATAYKYNLGFDPEADPAQGGYKSPRIIIPVTRGYYIGRSILKDTPPAFKALNNKGGKGAIFNFRALENSEIVFITEGIFDALSVIEAGAAAIALNSTSNCNLLLKKLEKKPTSAKLIICLDNDEAGRNKTPELAQGLQDLQINYCIANIAGTHKDANEAFIADKQAFIEAIKAAQQIEPIQAATEAAEPAQQNYIDNFIANIQGEQYKPHSTGLIWLDNLLGGGIVDKRILFLLAAPSAGKTTLCQQIAENIAATGKQFIFFNWEMSKDAMLAKAISCKLAQKGYFITSEEILRGYNWTDEQRNIILSAIQDYKENIYPNMKYNPDNIAAHPEQLKEYLFKTGQEAAKNGEQSPAIVIDYLHLITDSSKPDIKEVIKDSIEIIRRYVEAFNTFAILISATNRDTNKSGKLSMSSARDTSGIEYGADYVLTLNYYEVDKGTVNPEDRNEMSELKRRRLRNMLLYLDKNRYGATGTEQQLYFNAENNIFYSPTEFIPAELTGAALPFGSTEPQKEKENTKQIPKF